jgi:hypothetical protein
LLEDYFVNEDVLINFFEAVNNKKIEVAFEKNEKIKIQIIFFSTKIIELNLKF